MTAPATQFDPMAQEFPYFTRTQAAQYLCESVDTIDRRTIPLEGNARRVKNKIRYRMMPGATGRLFPRLLKSDCYAILPPERDPSPSELLEKKGRNFVVVK